MDSAINVEFFRKHYEDITSCRNALNANADKLNSNDENAIEALIPITEDYGREMVKKLVVNAVLRDSRNYSEQVRKWADNAIIAKFLYETDNVLSEYIPDQLSEAAIERIAMDIIDKEKNKQMIQSQQGTEYEVVLHNDYRSLLSLTNTDNMTVYCQCAIMPESFETANVAFSDGFVENLTVYYSEALAAYRNASLADERTDKARNVLLQQYNAFKDEMLSKEPKDIFEACYKISAVEDVYFYLTESAILTELQEEYIINSGENVLMDMAMDWYEYGDYAEELSDYINNSWNEKIFESETFEENSDEEELE